MIASKNIIYSSSSLFYFLTLRFGTNYQIGHKSVIRTMVSNSLNPGVISMVESVAETRELLTSFLSGIISTKTESTLIER